MTTNQKLMALYDQIAAIFKDELESDAKSLIEEAKLNPSEPTGIEDGRDLFESMLDSSSYFPFNDEIIGRIAHLFQLEDPNVPQDP